MLMHVKFVELPVVDLDRAVRFYSEQVGLRVVQDRPYSDDWRWLEMEIPGAATRIVLTKREGDAREDVPALILIADDVNATCEEMQRRGVLFTQPPTEAPWNRSEIFALFEDGEGNRIMIGSASVCQDNGRA